MVKRGFLLSAAVLAWAQCPAPDQLPAVRAVPRADANSRRAHEQLLRKARQGRIDVYFLGDSITRRWGASDPAYRDLLENWRKNFFGWNAANFGWGGDRVENILWRVENGELDDVHPKIVVLMAGTNNLGPTPPPPGDDGKLREVVAGVRAIVDTIRRKAPEAVVIVTGITPRNDRGTAIVGFIRRVNQCLAQLADGKRIRYLDLDDKLADASGRLFGDMTTDGLHLSVRGYQVWADALKPIFTEVLGPPAATDQAPPPTGNPALEEGPGRAP